MKLSHSDWGEGVMSDLKPSKPRERRVVQFVCISHTVQAVMTCIKVSMNNLQKQV